MSPIWWRLEANSSGSSGFSAQFCSGRYLEIRKPASSGSPNRVLLFRDCIWLDSGGGFSQCDERRRNILSGYGRCVFARRLGDASERALESALPLASRCSEGSDQALCILGIRRTSLSEFFRLCLRLICL